jgi:hypothetical protein
LVLNPPRERPIAWSSLFLGAGAVLMGAHDGAVDHCVFVVRVGGQALEQARPHPALGPAREPRMHLDRVAEALGQIAPWNASTVSVEDGIDEEPVIVGGHADRARAARQRVLDPLPLIITQCVAAHRSAPIKLTV